MDSQQNKDSFFQFELDPKTRLDFYKSMNLTTYSKPQPPPYWGINPYEANMPCTILLHDIPDHVTGRQIAQIIKQKFNEEVIDVKIKEKEGFVGKIDPIQNNSHTSREIKSIFGELSIGSAENVLNQEDNKNQINDIKQFLLDTNSQYQELQFYPNEIQQYGFKQMKGKYAIQQQDISDNKNQQQKNQTLHGNKKQRQAIVKILGQPTRLQHQLNGETISFSNYSFHQKYPTKVWYKKSFETTEEINQKNSERLKRDKVLTCESISLGVNKSGDSTFFSYYDKQNSIHVRNTKCYFTFKSWNKRLLKMVSVIIDSEDVAYKIEFSLKSCSNFSIYRDWHGNICIYFTFDITPRFYKVNNDARQYQALKFNENWQRCENFGVTQTDEIVSTFLTQFTILKVQFGQMQNEIDQEYINILFKGIQKKYKSFITTLKSDFPTKNLFQYANDNPLYLSKNIMNNLKVDFEIKYALLSMITQKKLNILDVDKDFLSQILDFSGKSPLSLEKTLKDIALRKKVEHHNLLATIASEYEKNKETEKIWSKDYTKSHVSKTKRVVVTPTQTIYHVEEQEISNTILREYPSLIQGYFLRVSFKDESFEPIKNMDSISDTKFRPLIEDFPILDRNFSFLAYSSSQLKSNSLWMFSNDNPKGVTAQQIQQATGKLESILNPSKHASRLGLLFASSQPMFDCQKEGINLNHIPDHVIYEKGHQQAQNPVREDENNKDDIRYTFTDGVGRISSDLMLQIREKINFKGMFSAIQIRCGGIKGVLVSDIGLYNKTIQYRSSMKKFESPQFGNRFELLEVSKFRYGYLNRQIMILLLGLGLNGDVFLDMQREHFDEIMRKDFKSGNILPYINNDQSLQAIKEYFKDCNQSGLAMENEPFYRRVYETIRIRSFVNVKQKSTILNKRSVRLIGIIDEYEVLERGQVFIAISTSNLDQEDREVIQAKQVLVTKNPCLHPGDIRVLEAVSNNQTQEKFAHITNCIVFPRKGFRPHTAEISGSDLDGDQYFASWDQRLIPPTTVDPFEYDQVPPVKYTQQVTISAIADFFIQFAKHDQLGRIDNSHLAIADKDSVNCLKCMKLAETHATAVDIPKNGFPLNNTSILNDNFATEFPDYFEREDKNKTFKSQSTLGQAYRQAKSLIENSDLKDLYKNGSKVAKEQLIYIDENFVMDGYQPYLEKAIFYLEQYYNDIEEIMDQNGVQTEFEIFSGNFLKFKDKKQKKKYTLEKLQEKMSLYVDELKQKYLQNFLEEFQDDIMIQYKEDALQRQQLKSYSKEYQKRILAKASAWYIASYFNDSCCDNTIRNNVYQVGMQNIYKKKSDLGEMQLIGLPWIAFSEFMLEIPRRKKEIEKLEPYFAEYF